MQKLLLLGSSMIMSIAVGLVLLNNLSDNDLKQAGSASAMIEISQQELRENHVTFPCAVPNTSLTINRILLYEGGFLEDGSNEEVVDILGIEVINNSCEFVQSASVELSSGNVHYRFKGSFFPPGVPVILLEQNRKKCPLNEFTFCRGAERIYSGEWISGEDMVIETLDLCTLKITNCSDQPIDNAVICYKNYLPHSALYAGGITYECRTGCLLPGESTTLYPGHYAKDYSRILGVRKIKRSGVLK